MYNVDELSEDLKKCNVGCNLNGHLFNYIMYADDLVLISPSSAGLSQLLHECEKFGTRHDLKYYNAKKSAVMVYRRRKHSNKPGWNDHVADLHKDARECFVMWCNNGKPRQGCIFDLMRQTRSQFKYALGTVKNNENVLRRESVANKLACSKSNKFWQWIRTMTSKSTSLPSSIEGVSGKHAISELWKSHFRRLLNVIQDDGLCDISCDTGYSGDIHVSTREVVMAVQALGANKASGLDGIVAEHLLYSSERWCTKHAMCLSGLYVHVFLPDSMLAVVLVPIIKDKTGRIDRIDNYRQLL